MTARWKIRWLFVVADKRVGLPSMQAVESLTTSSQPSRTMPLASLQVLTCRAMGSWETAMTDALVKAPWHLWLIGVVALLFNSIGVFDFVLSMAQGAAYQASAGMTPEQIAHYQAMPSWMKVVWAVGVFGAFLASILLLLRKRLALPVFVLSLVAFLISLIYTYVLTDGGAVMGRQMAIASAVIAALLVFFSGYSRRMAGRGVLR